MNERVLVVDDEIAIVDGLIALLDFENIPSAGAGSRGDAEALLTDEFFPIVIADLCLHTREDGLQLIRHLRESSPRSRIIMLSAHVTPDVEEQLLEDGVSLVLMKPAPSETIIDAVQSLLAELEAEAAANDSLSLEELYLTARKRLISIPCRRFNLTAAQAEDILHDAWLLFLQKRGLIRSTGPWLAGTIVNLARQAVGRRQRRREVDEDDGVMHEIAAPAADVDDVLAVRDALSRVDERTRTLCVLVGIEGLSYAEVSAATGLPLGSIGPLYIRAKKKLRSALGH
jgi:RNA polymerase sigma factor (sigma-70 family)